MPFECSCRCSKGVFIHNVRLSLILNKFQHFKTSCFEMVLSLRVPNRCWLLLWMVNVDNLFISPSSISFFLERVVHMLGILICIYLLKYVKKQNLVTMTYIELRVLHVYLLRTIDILHFSNNLIHATRKNANVHCMIYNKTSYLDVRS